MSDQHDEHERRGFPWMAAFFVALPILYVLSIGPVAAGFEALSIDPNAPITMVARAFYFPMIWPSYYSETYGDWLQWYVEIWSDLILGP